jgi:putative copper resistance protein D
LQDQLIWARAIHFGASMMLCGGLIFLVFIAEPCLRIADDLRMAQRVRARLAAINWASFAVAVLSGIAWPILLAERMSEEPLAQVLADGTIQTVLSNTDFGQVWMIRLTMSVALAALLAWPKEAAALLVASALTGSLAWAGHAAASPGALGIIHLIADVLHLIAAAAWFGALIPLALLLTSLRRAETPAAVKAAREALSRFSPLGIVSVGTLVATGAVNTFMLAGSIPALTATDYGQLLGVKVAAFLVMLSFGAVNRLWLSPRVVPAVEATDRAAALRAIERNSLIEAVLGTAIVLIVGLLGTLPPGLADSAGN